FKPRVAGQFWRCGCAGRTRSGAPVSTDYGGKSGRHTQSPPQPPGKVIQLEAQSHSALHEYPAIVWLRLSILPLLLGGCDDSPCPGALAYAFGQALAGNFLLHQGERFLLADALAGYAQDNTRRTQIKEATAAAETDERQPDALCRHTGRHNCNVDGSLQPDCARHANHGQAAEAVR